MSSDENESEEEEEQERILKQQQPHAVSKIIDAISKSSNTAKNLIETICANKDACNTVTLAKRNLCVRAVVSYMIAVHCNPKDKPRLTYRLFKAYRAPCAKIFGDEPTQWFDDRSDPVRPGKKRTRNQRQQPDGYLYRRFKRVQADWRRKNPESQLELKSAEKDRVQEKRLKKESRIRQRTPIEGKTLGRPKGSQNKKLFQGPLTSGEGNE